MLTVFFPNLTNATDIVTTFYYFSMQIFWKARTRAKEELNEQLIHFQQKRIAGLATIFGPTDISLDESISDKGRETKIIETYLLPKMEPYL